MGGHVPRITALCNPLGGGRVSHSNLDRVRETSPHIRSKEQFAMDKGIRRNAFHGVIGALIGTFLLAGSPQRPAPPATLADEFLGPGK